MKRICKQCGKEFELSESEISFYKSKGLELPKRCQSCRNQNKADKTNAGHTQRTDKGRNSVGLDTSAGSISRGSGSNHNGGNNKSYIVVAIAAALMILTAFGVKNFFSADSERLMVSEDVVVPGIESGQEAFSGTPGNVISDPPGETQQPPVSENVDELPQSEQPEIQTQPDTQTEAASQAIPETSDKAYNFRKAQYLTEHFQKHGEEFPYATEDEYLQGANNVINNPDALHKLEAEDGDDVYYVENTNEFVVVSTDGYIRTYFKASMDYYNRQ